MRRGRTGRGRVNGSSSGAAGGGKPPLESGYNVKKHAEHTTLMAVNFGPPAAIDSGQFPRAAPR